MQTAKAASPSRMNEFSDSLADLDTGLMDVFKAGKSLTKANVQKCKYYQKIKNDPDHCFQGHYNLQVWYN